MIIKRMIATIVSSAMLIGTNFYLTSNAESNLRQDYYYGDVNRDGSITPIDIWYIQSYLVGHLSPTAEQFTAMDYNRDKVVDWYDARKLMYDRALNNVSYNIISSNYTLTNNEELTYLKHICNTGSGSSYSEYTLSALSTPLNNLLFDNYSPRAIDLPDNENAGCVELLSTDYNDIESMGSGFLISDNIIATAAHCVYDNGFVNSVRIKVYNENCSDIYAEIEASEIHIPKLYKTESDNFKYDYALIYFDENDIEYNDDYPTYEVSDSVVDVGVMSNQFMSTNSNLTVSGFTGDGTHIWRRYYSTGNVQSCPYESDYYYQTAAICQGGQSGGLTYYEPYNDIKSAVGINTQFAGTDDVGSSRGVRLTTTLLQFYFNNDNIS